MVRKLFDGTVYAIGGELHFTVTNGRGKRAGIQLHINFGTRKPSWQRITDDDLSRTIDYINFVNPRKVFLSGHDSCDYYLNCYRDS